MVMKIFLVVIVFVALKFWELIKYIGRLIGDLWLVSWKPMLIAIGIIIGIVLSMIGFVKLIEWQYNLFNGHVYEFFLIVIDFFIIYWVAFFVKYVIEYWDYEVKPFIVMNWEKATQIVDKKIYRK